MHLYFVLRRVAFNRAGVLPHFSDSGQCMVNSHFDPPTQVQVAGAALLYAERAW